MFKNLFFLVISIFMLIGCGGGSGSSNESSSSGSETIANTSSVTISGIATDEPISNGIVVIKDLNGNELKTINTDLNGSFSLEVDSSKITDGYMLSVSGGKIGNDDFNGTLNAVYTGSHDKTKANITLITSLIQKLSEDEAGTALEKRDKAIKRLVDIGMIQEEDWFEENPENLELPLLQNEVKSRGLANWLNDMKSDLADNELSIDSHQIFTRSHGGINRIFISPMDSVSLFAGQTSSLQVSGTFLDNNESNISVTKTSGPSWATVDGTTLNIAPPETETNFTTYTLSIEIFANGTKKGRKKDITISLLKSVVLVTGELGIAGGRIENEWKDISISVDANKLSQDYTITYYGGLNENNEMSFWFKTTPDMNQTEMLMLNLNQPSYETIKNNYLMDEDAINRSLKRKIISRGDVTEYGTIGHDYAPYANSYIPNECKPGVLGNQLNEMVWTDENKDGVYLPYVWQGNIAVFNNNFIQVGEGLTGGIPRVQLSKVVRGGAKILCASSLRSQVKEDDSAITGKEAVLFVHGFINTGNLGGYDIGGGKVGGEYFANFPQLIKDYEINGQELMPFAFQWRTNAKFEDVASELGRAVKQLKKATGKKVHIIAHSFGGLLTRTLAQGLASAPYYNKSFAEEHIASITTVGTPHSGTFGMKKTIEFEGEGDVTFPEGRNGIAGGGIELCYAITCFQTGSIFKPSSELYGTKDKAGYIVYKLFQELDSYPNIPTQVLIGLVPESRTITKQDNDLYSITYDFLDDEAIANPGAGDKLISIFGQRIIPDGDQSDLNEVYNDNNIEEHILHMDSTYKDISIFNRSKDDDLLSLFETNWDNDWTKENYAENIEFNALTNYMFGYNHRTGQYKKLTLADSNGANTLPYDMLVSDAYKMYKNTILNSEVGLQNCNDANTCGHPTWSYFKTFLKDKVDTSGEVIEDETIFVSGKVVQDGGVPTEAYRVAVFANGNFLTGKSIEAGISDYNISVEFMPLTEYYVVIDPEELNYRTATSNIEKTDTNVIDSYSREESDLSFNDILIVDREYKTSEIAITLKDATDNTALSDYNITIYNGNNPIIKAHTDNASYSTILGLGDYTCVATKTGYKESTPIPCYSKKDEVTSYEINIYRDEAVGTARRIRVLADDITPWDTNSFTTIMSANGYTEGLLNNQYSVIPSDEIVNTDMIVGKDLVIIMNDQTQTFYDRLANSMDKIETFVQNGGVLLFEACDRGWNNGSLVTAGINELPGGTTLIHNYDSTNTNVNINSTLMTGLDTTLNGSSASHESFENLPENTTVYTTDSNGKATLVEYKYGLGWIILTGQPLEHGYNAPNTMGEIYPKLYNYILGNISNDIESRNINRSLRSNTIVIPSHK